MMGGAKAHYDGIVAFSQTDFTEDLKKFSVPTLVMHGDDDQIVPYADSGPLSAKLVKGGVLKTYKGFPHGHANYECRRDQCRSSRIHRVVKVRLRTTFSHALPAITGPFQSK
jgi:pimeloyl-ACP methyl ester carboxylesterase